VTCCETQTYKDLSTPRKCEKVNIMHANVQDTTAFFTFQLLLCNCFSILGWRSWFGIPIHFLDASQYACFYAYYVGACKCACMHIYMYVDIEKITHAPPRADSHLDVCSQTRFKVHIIGNFFGFSLQWNSLSTRQVFMLIWSSQHLLITCYEHRIHVFLEATGVRRAASKCQILEDLQWRVSDDSRLSNLNRLCYV